MSLMTCFGYLSYCKINLQSFELCFFIFELLSFYHIISEQVLSRLGSL